MITVLKVEKLSVKVLKYIHPKPRNLNLHPILFHLFSVWCV